ncbi:TetR/AcrR family transcriptional regulator [Paenibacillus alba]|uniref:TetR/AcrR family transcriptional regulator n=1 Tax=Paenibacillus alba TaxID=1197127 RepID=A0ABU6G7G8_9BACL|nr:TetR/AcrR family transcriptional regulator [Paenibacillus alba]MEC0230111.1 TetR/AcrR family transcriptional regulator [Paenibacillus alba]
MYSGTNPSAIRSQKWIRDSLLQLLEEKPYKKISIKEISDKSDLARQTFYQLFDSKEEIIEYHLDSLFQEYLLEVQNLEVATTVELARIYFVFFQNNGEFIDQLIQNDLIHILNQKFFFYLGEIHTVLHHTLNITEYASAFISSGLVGILVYWFKQNRQMPIDQLAVLISDILSPFPNSQR